MGKSDVKGWGISECVPSGHPASVDVIATCQDLSTRSCYMDCICCSVVLYHLAAVAE